MAILNNQSHECRLYKRVPNSSEMNNVGMVFYAELVSDDELSHTQRIANLRTPETKKTIRTSSTNVYDFVDGKLERGYVLFQGVIYQIQNVVFDYNQAKFIICWTIFSRIPTTQRDKGF